MRQPILYVFFHCLGLVFFLNIATAQQSNWQQRAEYHMDIHVDTDNHKLSGSQIITYHNHSPDTLNRVYYHLYFNAFQPGSMMDERSRTIADPDRRVMSRISYLKEDEIGYHQIYSLLQDGQDARFRVEGTVLIVDLPSPILPGTSTVLDMTFGSQIPVQIRRSGRNNAEGIAYSMAQWYPKLAEYDQNGWHTHPYVGREFHGIWSDFNVYITIDRNFTVGGTGYLQNPQEIGHGYEYKNLPLSIPDSEKLTWHFYAPNVIDFMWAADDSFTHERIKMDDGPEIHLLYVPGDKTRNWEFLGDFTKEAMTFLQDYIGDYPYDQFSIIQGGDGGMEYPMSTLITGHRSLRSLVGVTVHELMHMWFHTSLATNESLHHWMDEGFTVYMSNITMQHLFNTPGNPHLGTTLSYLRLVHDQLEEPMVQHADHFETNAAYVTASYRKGALVLRHLEYIVGSDILKRSLQRYYSEWKFKHPTPVDFRRIVEKESGLQLDWFFETMLNTTRTIDLAIKSVEKEGEQTRINLINKGDFLMPVELLVEYENGNTEIIYIPRHEMLFVPSANHQQSNQTNLDSWYWTHKEYSFLLPVHRSEIKRLVIDANHYLGDTNRLNNSWPFPVSYQFLQPGNQHFSELELGYRPVLWYGEKSGIHAGLRIMGNYLFGTKAIQAQFTLTSGQQSNKPGLDKVDVDYMFSFRDRWRFLGPEGWWNVSAKRFYGIDQQRIGIEKRLGTYGRLETLEQTILIEAFHLRKTADRLIPSLSGDWQRGSLAGIKAVYEFEDDTQTGFSINLKNAISGTTRASHALQIRANKTFISNDYRFSSRFGMDLGGGSTQMPVQQRYNLSQGSTIERWNQTAYWSVANISQSFYDDSHLVYDSGNALSAYTITGSNNNNIIGNNAISFTIWNTARPFLTGYMRPLLLEIFAGTGRAWSGSFLHDFKLPSKQNSYLATFGAGISYEFKEIPGVNRWTRQSEFLNTLQLSIRTPFYVHNPADGSDWKMRWVIGVSQSF